MELLRSSQSAGDQNPHLSPYQTSSTHPYFLDNVYDNGWNNPKEGETTSMGSEATLLTGFIGASEMHHHAPKLEDFLGDSSCQTDGTQDDSSLTQIYDSHQHGVSGSYFNREVHDLKTIQGFPSFSSNSGSEVDSSIARGQQHLTAPLSLGVDGDYAIINSSINENPKTRSLKETAIVISGTPDSKKVIDNFGHRTSIYRGVTRHRWTGRYEAHLWDNSCRREGQARKGRQGGYDKEEKAARAYDLAALKYWGPTSTTNFPVSSYSKELEEMKYISKQEFIASLRRHHQQGRWQARIGRVAGNKDLYLGTFATEEEAAEAYDIAAIKFRGLNAVTNFEMNRYDVEAIMKSALPIGGAAKRLKASSEPDPKPVPCIDQNSNGGDVNFGSMQQISTSPIDALLYHHHNQVFHHFTPHNNVFAVDAMSASSSMVPPSEFFIWPQQPY